MKLTEEQEKQLIRQEVDHEGHAQCVLALYPGKFRHNDTHGWLMYNGKYWDGEGAKQGVERAVTNTLQYRRVLFAKGDELKKARFCSTWRNTVTSTVAQIAKNANVFTPIGRFDTNDKELNAENGVINLANGELSPHNPSQLFTYCIPTTYEKDAALPIAWLEFLTSIGLSDEVISYLQIAIGYSLTGYTSEEVMFYLHGETRSGKGTFTEVLNHMLGALSTGVSMETFTTKRVGDTSRFDMAPLKGKRFVTASESTESGKLNPATIKSVTGGDEIYCSFKRKDHFSYRPQFKIWLTSNFQVNVDVDDDAAWGRLRVIRFPNSFLGKEDKTLKSRLKSDDSLVKILKWAVDGARDWFVLKSTGLPLPDEIKEAVADHRLQLDGIGQYLDTYCEFDHELFIEGRKLYASYKAWCEDEGYGVAYRKRFTQSLEKKGYKSGQKKVNGKNMRGYHGVSFKKDTDIPEPEPFGEL